ncbi:MAG: type II toxin-antitoxin system RelE/ParE family toxin [Xanthobacteraceae bacterium]
MNVRYSALALAELDEILASIAAENPSAAARFAGRVQRVVLRIGRFPEGAPKISQRSEVRVVPLVRYPYLILYTVVADEVMILRIRHGARRSPWDTA